MGRSRRNPTFFPVTVIERSNGAAMMVSLCTLGKPVIIQVGCEDHQDICNDQQPSNLTFTPSSKANARNSDPKVATVLDY
ncbi:hypothetical protein CEP54_014761 [Fusarium duplospermum]|uniref:Uncharacterized protein n=1 Tax=Fusarium duplospermum TaxID=1325734 RepID=A0A428NU26_9HYPO|nr:hypothetical protein CEP54_014761 [Fusarium duplospermum]